MTSNCSGPDDADDRMAQAGLGHEHLHQAFFLELLHRFVEALVAHVGRPQVGEALGRKLRNRRIADLPARVERVADGQPARG